MRKLFFAFVMVVLIVSSAAAQGAGDAAELTKLLNDFLAGASTNDVAMHDRFWADDLIYTRSAGSRVTKAEVMRGVRNAPAQRPDAPKTVFTAEDIQIQQYGNTAVVAFRLVSTTDNNGAKTLANNLNSGTFVKRDGKWQVVSWQSTRMPRSEDENKKDVTSAEATLQQALLNADTRRITALTDSGFSWAQSDGTQMNRAQLVDALSTGKLKYSRPETPNVVVTVFGETAIVRGQTPKELYTLTFVSQGGTWRAVAMHSSRTQ